MKAAADGLPVVGDTGTTLGARPERENAPADTEIHADGTVRPYAGGMSTSPPPVTNLQPHRRPKKHGGRGKGIEVFELDTDDLPDELRARPDPGAPERHVLIEPSRAMGFEEYQRALHSTRVLWRQLR